MWADCFELIFCLFSQERQRYRKNQLEASENPGGCLSLIIDGMDQNKTNIPSLVRIPKSCQNLWTLRTHLTGVVVHGLGHHCLFDYLQWPHDCNLTLTCILFILQEISKSRVLPLKLYVQMDNCKCITKLQLQDRSWHHNIIAWRVHAVHFTTEISSSKLWCLSIYCPK